MADAVTPDDPFSALVNIKEPLYILATEQMIRHILSKYNNSPNHHLIGAFSDGILIGVIGIEITDEICTINHISYQLKIE